MESSGVMIKFADVLESTWHIAHSQSTFIQNFELTSFFFFFQERPYTSLLYACEVIHDETFNAVERAVDQELGDMSYPRLPYLLTV